VSPGAEEEQPDSKYTPNFGTGHAFVPSVPRTYSLVRPVFAFWPDIGQVVRIPAGARITMVLIGNGLSVCNALWDGRSFLVFQDDIRSNGIAAELGG